MADVLVRLVLVHLAVACQVEAKETERVLKETTADQSEEWRPVLLKLEKLKLTEKLQSFKAFEILHTALHECWRQSNKLESYKKDHRKDCRKHILEYTPARDKAIGTYNRIQSYQLPEGITTATVEKRLKLVDLEYDNLQYMWEKQNNREVEDIVFKTARKARLEKMRKLDEMANVKGKEEMILEKLQRLLKKHAELTKKTKGGVKTMSHVMLEKIFSADKGEKFKVFGNA